MKTYIGTRDGQGTAHVFVQTGNAMRALPLRLDIANHSPAGSTGATPAAGRRSSRLQSLPTRSAMTSAPTGSIRPLSATGLRRYSRTSTGK